MSAATGWVRFCFADVDAETGIPYSRTPFGDLPGFAAAVVRRQGWCSGEWDEMVKMEETEDFIDPDRSWEVGPAEAAAACQPDIDTIAVIGW
jgi:hypothetical protein